MIHYNKSTISINNSLHSYLSFANNKKINSYKFKYIQNIFKNTKLVINLVSKKSSDKKNFNNYKWIVQKNLMKNGLTKSFQNITYKSYLFLSKFYPKLSLMKMLKRFFNLYSFVFEYIETYPIYKKRKSKRPSFVAVFRNIHKNRRKVVEFLKTFFRNDLKLKLKKRFYSVFLTLGSKKTSLVNTQINLYKKTYQNFNRFSNQFNIRSSNVYNKNLKKKMDYLNIKWKYPYIKKHKSQYKKRLISQSFRIKKIILNKLIEYNNNYKFIKKFNSDKFYLTQKNIFLKNTNKITNVLGLFYFKWIKIRQKKMNKFLIKCLSKINIKNSLFDYINFLQLNKLIKNNLNNYRYNRYKNLNSFLKTYRLLKMNNLEQSQKLINVSFSTNKITWNKYNAHVKKLIKKITYKNYSKKIKVKKLIKKIKVKKLSHLSKKTKNFNSSLFNYFFNQKNVILTIKFKSFNKYQLISGVDNILSYSEKFLSKSNVRIQNYNIFSKEKKLTILKSSHVNKSAQQHIAQRTYFKTIKFILINNNNFDNNFRLLNSLIKNISKIDNNLHFDIFIN